MKFSYLSIAIPLILFTINSAADYTIEEFTLGGRGIPQKPNDIISSIEGENLQEVSVNENVNPGEMIMRVRYSPSEYRLYKGKFNQSAFREDLYVFPLSTDPTLLELVKNKIYETDNTINPNKDLSRIYWDNANIYVPLLPTIYWKEGEQWRSLKGISIKDNDAIAAMTGELTIKTIPENADVYLNGEKQISKYIKNLSPGKYIVSAQMQGYQTIQKTVVVRTLKAQGDIIRENITLLIASGFLNVKTTPQGATVELVADSKKVAPIKGVTPFDQSFLEPGNYRLIITKDQYRRVDTTISIAMSCTTKIVKNLQTVVGSVVMNSIPPGAKIFLNGQALGETPLSMDQQLAGRYQIKAESNLYEPYIDSITIKAGQENKFNFYMKGDFGTLVLPQAPDGFSFSVNGEYKETGSHKLGKGVYTIRFDGRELYSSFDTTVTLTIGSAINIIPAWHRLTGSLKVETTPLEADVLIDNKKAGVSPVFLKDIETGPHDIAVRKLGYKLLTRQVHVSKDQITPVSFAMPQIPDRDGDNVEDDKDECPDYFGMVNGCDSDNSVLYRFETTPENAHLFKNGEDAGVTPLRLSMREGKHTLKLTHPDCYDTTFSFTSKNWKGFAGDNIVSIPLNFTAEHIAHLDKLEKEKQRQIELARKERKRKNKIIRIISFGSCGAGMVGAGYYYNKRYDDAYEDYLKVKNPNNTDSKWEIVEKYKNYRNWLYVGAGVFSGLCTISFIF